MQAAGVAPYNSNVHLILGADSVIWTGDHVASYLAKYMTIETNGTPMTVQAAWVARVHNAGLTTLAAMAGQGGNFFPTPGFTATKPAQIGHFSPWHRCCFPAGGNCCMIDALFNDPGYLGAKRMLDATVARHEAIASNIANAETPHYRRLDLAPSFSKELQNALASNDVARLNSLQTAIAPDPKAVSANRDGNTVNLEKELVEMGQNTLENAVQTQIVSASLAKLRMAITGKT
jgi:flagellar basal-body rod protein FlgB